MLERGDMEPAKERLREARAIMRRIGLAELGEWDNRDLNYGGIRARMRQQGDTFAIAIEHDGQMVREVAVRTVGSRRHQQFLVCRGDELVRLPIAWSVEEQRFFHMNGAFL